VTRPPLARAWTRRDVVKSGLAALAAAAGPGEGALWRIARPRVGTVVLFQGDSITDCGRNRGAGDPNVAGALGTGYPLLVVSAELAAHPESGLQFYNRGVSGNKVPDLEQRWAADTLALKPDVLSVLIGVNDFWHKKNGYTGTVADYEAGFAALLQTTRQALPAVRLVVIEPFVLRCGAVDATWFPEFDERRAAAARVARQAKATFVPMQARFTELAARTSPEYWAADGVHPTPAGHALIAERWRRTVRLP
jgi:lysophospholipase L1-like esterase